MSFLHVCINVSDAETTAAWYESQLGFERAWEFTTEDGTTRNVYVTDDQGIEIQLSETEGIEDVEDGTAWDHLAVRVEDVDAAVEAIDHYGLEQAPTDVPPAGARVAFVSDPDGHTVELIEPLGE